MWQVGSTGTAPSAQPDNKEDTMLESTRVKDKLIGYAPKFVGGLPVSFPNLDLAEFRVVTGSPTGAVQSGQAQYSVADMAYTNATLSLIPDYAVPTGYRCYVSNFTLNVLANTAWTGGTWLSLQDGAGFPVAHVPLAALNAGAKINLSVSQLLFPYAPTVSSYAATTGVMTFASSTFVNLLMKDSPFQVIAGTGIGQTGIVKSNTTTTITPVTILGTALDNTSVVAFHYVPLTGATSTVLTNSHAAWPTTVDLRGNFVVVLAGTGVGQTAQIVSNTATAITVAAMVTTLDATSIIMITSNPELMGSVELGFNQACLTQSKGLQMVAGGTFTTAGTARIAVDGFTQA